MPRRPFTAVLMALALLASVAGAPDAWARAGGGGSFGSRGSYTYRPPPATTTAPYSAQPMQRSTTPYTAPSYGGSPAMGGSPAFGGRSSFMSGLFGGLIGAGIGSLLFGHGFFGGGFGFGGFIGFLLQIFLLVMLARFVLRLFRGRSAAFAGPPRFDRTGAPPAGMGMGGGFGAGGAPATAPVAIGPADYQAFEALLKAVQAAWTAQDINALRGLTTPEMLGYFAEQLADQSSRGVRNMVTDVRLEKGDLAEAWAEQGRQYATVAMRFSMVDATRDASGRIVEGSDTVRTLATELWTFLRAPGGRWVLSAIQQAR